MPRSSLRPWVRALAPVLALSVLAGCSTDQTATTPVPTTPVSASVPGVELTPPLDHLHGMHLAADGTILAGTHTGLFALAADGTTTRVGASDDDFMGLTGAPGTDHLFASGHPGPSSTAPNPLGLTESTDAGRSWTPKSLTGEVDFHALATDGQLLVGFDGVTGLLTSTDAGATWTTAATIGAAALAITDAGVWAATAGGLQHSTNAGRSFTTVPDAPRLALLSPANDGSLWGIDTTGTAWRSHTGQTWEQRATVGPAEAILAIDFGTAYASTAQTLYPLN
ncbi:exo-alpha-sialidase [Nocardia cyriacigeorgica]|uniref:F510_1955 family glycosylhydrolase n=1 Tax=Nocardia cyriacigeorgica TaxID=135487 RepID=UPI001894B5B1|nr:exo-alpha-sialidase [Nocardia cyriacigeorgica]MBF6097704.1 exo-alpha-sialidase [Nocardia cyriacigeorgica]MBF6161653.1 exo-alpha-sialidase [Nocardia cyriacigeorgica]MBF6200451.1 exo-alpha-sialidase [Nocardia cyriacigeorgica]MBF6342085.1 exo-alpha-sialidase [Nocardia cyriacigeorgica]MBF6512951.1 exo-alpha-sialidase [Nocardia cyriacigeorgica]